MAKKKTRKDIRKLLNQQDKARAAKKKEIARNNKKSK